MDGGPFRSGCRSNGQFRGGGGGRGNFSNRLPSHGGGAPTSFRSRGRVRMGRYGGKKQHQTASDSQPAPAGEQSSATGGDKQQAPSASALLQFPLLPIAWCDTCRVDCNSLQILEQHKNGKRHKKTVQKLEEIQKRQKLFAELPVKAMPDMMLLGALSEKVAGVREVKKVSSAPEEITADAMLSAQVGEATETSDTGQMNDANKTCNSELKPAVVLTTQTDFEARVNKAQTAECQLEPAKVGSATDAPPSAASISDEHFTDGSKEPPSCDGSHKRRGGMKRKMMVGRGRKRLRSSGPVRGRAPEHPKERPRVCTLCSVTCESLVVFESHLAGKKHISKIRRLQGQGTVYGPITGYVPPNQPSPAHPIPGREPLFFGLMNHEALEQETYIGLNELQAENHMFHQGVQGDPSRGAEGGSPEPQTMEGLEKLECEVIPSN